ncbi:hypothetical protein JCM10207_000650 [Rhodosporidiobolus poonsookiae]
MSLNSRPQPQQRNYGNPPPADAFTSYRPQPPASQQPPQRNNSTSGGGNNPPPAHSQQQGQQQHQQQQGSSNKPPPLTLEQSKAVAHTHYSALKRWLIQEDALASGSTRSNARDKLTRLTRQQFQELSTDVYDELMRRQEDAAGRPGDQPFLPVRQDFHPKRNQARQKLATLPILRFRDLASDVYYELDRRYPEFAEEDDNTDGQGYSSPPGAGTPTNAYGTAPHSRSGSLASQNPNGMASPPPPSNLNARRAPTPQQQQSHSPSGSGSQSASHSQSPSFASASLSSAVPAGNDVVVPNKSTMMVEEPGFPPASSSSSSAISPPPASPLDGPSAEDRRGSVERALSPPPVNYGTGGRSLLASPPLGSGHDDDAEELAPSATAAGAAGSPRLGGPGGARGMQSQGQGQGQGGQGGHQSRASETSSIGTRFFGGYAGSAAASEAGGRRSWDYDPAALDKVKSEYEYKLAMLQNRVGELERENDDAAAALRGRQGDMDRIRELEREVGEVRERFDDQAAQFRSLQQDHDALRASSARSPPPPSTSVSGGDAHLQSRLHEAEDLAHELRGEVSSLVDELRMVNDRCEDLHREVEGEREGKERAEKEAQEWKGRWQAAKMELRNIKATSQLFSSSISVDADYMPASSDGLIKDTSVAAFQTSIDDLLQAARSKEPSSVLPAARAVVSACEKLDTDIQSIPSTRLASLPLSDQDLVNSLKGKVNATLSNLMTASKNHAMSFGVSPVSLLDAAASHLAATIVELVRILKIRRTTGSSGGGGRSSLDPSSVFGLSRNGAGFNHEPMPPLPEQPPAPLSFSAPRDPSPDVGPAPPAKERDPLASAAQQQQSAQANQAKEKSAGYLSGGMAFLGGGGVAGVTKALEAMGIGSGKRSSVDSHDGDRTLTTAPAPAAASAQPAPSTSKPERESTAPSTSTMSLDSSLLASPSERESDYGSQHGGYSRGGPGAGGRYDSYDQHQQPQGYGGYGQSSSLDTPQQSQYQSHSPSSFGGQDDGRASPYGAGPGSELGQRNDGPAYEYGADAQREGAYGGYADDAAYDQQGGYGGEMNGVGGYGSPGLSRSERDPEELRAYIENQTENIVHSIQQLLSAIRSGAQGSELNDNLTQIITIVASIVAISNEALPDSARADAGPILQDLTRYCDQLSEMQNGEFTKSTKQAMAAASFGVAKSLKQLTSFLSPP